MNLADTVVIKNENTFLVALRDSRLPAGQQHAIGLFHRDCRHLSTHELRLNGELPLLLQASDAAGLRARHELTNPPLELPDGSELPAQSLSMRVERALEDGFRLRERIELVSHHWEATEVILELALRADFAPMLAIRGLVSGAHTDAKLTLDGSRLRFRAEGRDGVERSTAVSLSRAPDEASDAVLRFAVPLELRATHEITLDVTVAEAGDGVAPQAPRRSAPPPRTHIRSDDELFDRVLGRSLADLELLRSELEGHTYFAAGLPWYATLFGRDSLITAMETISFVPGVAEETLRLLGGMLGRVVDHERDEEPGKVLHELRVGEPANLGETAFARYYGTTDATPLWLCLLADHADWAGGLDLFRELRPQVDAALEWIARYGDADGDALVEYARHAPNGLVNHGWKDSWDGVPGADGRPLEPPIALVEVQGYTVRALRRIARLLDHDGEGARADELRERAARTEAALERMWLEQQSAYAIGLGSEDRPGSGMTSNPGHLLWAGAIGGDRARRVRDVLMSEAMFSGWGVRTLAEGHPGYNPVGYHTGTVWPHDTALIAHGLRRYGYDEDFTLIFEGLLEAASQFDDYRLPELFAGHPRRTDESPVHYPVACAPQAWAAGAIPYLLKWGLGLCPDGLNGRLRIVRPSLPRWLGRVELSGLQIGGSEVDLCFERSGERVTLASADVRGDVEVVLEIAGSRRMLEDV